ncbi:MAG: glucose-1-phosphate cytidylyltransferase [Desulfobacterales bacterium]|nr:glucose-1-phosphate cytidylyltransferase [Desulfobacterales bacterium]
MQTVILCGGLGTRLREETEFRPKPMVNIGDKPILWHIMKIFSCFGHSDFVLPLGYKGEMIKEYFWHYELMNNDVTIELGKQDSCCLHNCHDEAGWEITLVNTGEKTLKGGRLKRIEKYIKDDAFMLTYGDGVADIDINDLLEFHQQHGKIATVTGVPPTARFGELSINNDQVISFQEKPEASKSGQISGGFFVLNKDIFDFLSEDENCDLEFGALEKIAAAGELMVYKHSGFWACMDTVRDVEYLNKLWAEGNAKWKIW